MLAASFDEEMGLIRTIATGFQTDTDIENHLAQMASLVRRAKAYTGHALHLVDAVDAQVQPATGSGPIQREASRGRIKVDRVAIVTTSALAKMQTQRLYGDMPLRVFDCMQEAIAWLQSFQSLAKAS